MSVTEAVIEKLRSLSSEEQKKVLAFVESLRTLPEEPPKRKDPKGMFADRGVHVTAEEIDEVRHEMWGNFPRHFTEEDT